MSPTASLSYVASLCDAGGLFEHASGARANANEGQCSDDNGRALRLACILSSDPDAHFIATVALGFLEEAWDGSEFRLRRRLGTWEGRSDDSTGRALYGLGYAAVHAPWPEVRLRARTLFDAGAAWRSTSPRAMSYAGLGAAAIQDAEGDAGARGLLEACASVLAGTGVWYEARLAYANALLCEAQMVAGSVLGEPEMRRSGLEWLSWLIVHEGLGRADHFSFTPVNGSELADTRVRFDQQPTEAGTMAEAAYRAFCYTGDAAYAVAVEAAAEWFFGANDANLVLYDPVSGGCFDGLGEHGVNRNEGAESALALVSAMIAKGRLGEWLARGGAGVSFARGGTR